MPVVLTMPSESGDGRCRFRLGRCIDVLSVPDTLRPELFSMEHFSAYSHSALPYRHVAVFRFSALGDVAMTVPVVYEVCRAYPGIRFTLFTKKTVAPLFVYPPDNLTVSMRLPTFIMSCVLVWSDSFLRFRASNGRFSIRVVWRNVVW